MTACIICGVAMRPHIHFKGHTVVWCDDCDFGRLDADLTPKMVASFYEGDYYTHAIVDPPLAVGTSDKIRNHLAWRLDFGTPLKPPPRANGAMSVCDIGCGGGRILKMFKDAGYDVLGIEPDPLARQLAADRNAGTVIPGTAEALPSELNGKTFDVIVMSHALEHCIDPVTAIRAAAGLAKAGGRLLIEVPNNAAIGFRKHGAAWPWADIPKHLSYFTEQSLVALLSKVGLRASKVDYVGFHRQFTRPWLDEMKQLSGGRDFSCEAWLRLIRTGLAPKGQKYDSVRITAVARQAQN